MRDMLLGAHPDDIDITVEGKAPEFVQFLSREWREYFTDFPSPQKPIVFKKYGTVKLPFGKEVMSGISVLDFASTREERYPVPGGRPEITFSGIEVDLKRRDFRLNAIALELSPGKFGEILDPLEGAEDLRGHIIGAIHEKSFEDDPARIIRAFRFRSRLQFEFEHGTRALIDSALGSENLKTLPRQRFFDEMRKALSEEDPAPVIQALAENKVLDLFLPSSWRRTSVPNLDALVTINRETLGESPVWQVILSRLVGDIREEDYRDWLLLHGLSPKQAENLLGIRKKLDR